MQRVFWEVQEYFVYFKPFKMRDAAKYPHSYDEMFSEFVK